MTETQRAIIKAFAEHNMNTAATAKALFFHSNNIYEHLNRVKEKTGLDPRNFFDLHELYKIATTGEEQE